MSEDQYKAIFSKNLKYYMYINGKTQIDLINDLGFNKSAVSTWCNGTRLPRMDKVEQLARYFGINRSDLIEDKDKSESQEESYYTNPETAKIAQEIYENKDLSLLFDAAKDATPEDLQTVHTMLMALKKKERGED